MPLAGPVCAFGQFLLREPRCPPIKDNIAGQTVKPTSAIANSTAGGSAKAGKWTEN
jgi:hypothetical protein